jgi:hypothetical protein
MDPTLSRTQRQVTLKLDTIQYSNRPTSFFVYKYHVGAAKFRKDILPNMCTVLLKPACVSNKFFCYFFQTV